jgi:hypothetical protein
VIVESCDEFVWRIAGVLLRSSRLLLLFVPGTIVLLSVLVFEQPSPDKVTQYGSLGTSLLGVVIAYFLGHVVYPVNLLLRPLFYWGLLDKESDSDFGRKYLDTIERHASAYEAEVSRYRSLARFCSAMVPPSVMLGVAGAFRWQEPWLCLVVALLAAAGFVWRYRRYHTQFLDFVEELSKMKRGPS